MNPRLRKILTGIAFRQEYVCLPLEHLQNPLMVHLTARNSTSAMDVTSHHVFVGYSPAIMAVPFSNGADSAASEEEMCLGFTNGEFALDSHWKGFPASRRDVARLAMKRVREHHFDDVALAFYVGTLGEHRFLNRFYQAVNNRLESAKKKPVDNVALPGNLYEQVRIAYSIPRLISLISVGDSKSMNLFPTDLHGPLGVYHYMSSLRIGGKACEQVESHRRIVISEVDATIYRKVYALGKNHMKELTDPRSFELHPSASTMLGIPLPLGVVSYRELEWVNYLEIGIHRLYCYRVLHAERITASARLAHVHKYYVQWRENSRLKTEYLFR